MKNKEITTDRIWFLIGGLMLILIGGFTIIDPITPHPRLGVTTDSSGYNVPLGIFVAVSGIVLLYCMAGYMID